MNKNDITITITESQHELLIDVLNHAQDAMDLAVSYDVLYGLPLENSIVQKYTMMENLKEMIQELWWDRFE